ncbi:MAG: nucleotidyltransferase domain-containing protein [Calditrichaeota bacterium]|nr:nucleotidyltransferase domain-containing protein [Calditrichota bacterium]
MARVPHTPDEIFEAFVADYRALFGEQLVSIVLYGSGARGEYVRKRSDINFLIVLSEEGMKEIGKALPVVAKWRKRNVSTPLFMTPEYIASSLDSFPMEFLSLKQHHRVVFGQDPLQQLEIDRKLLRLQCEREVKGKLLHLREAYLATEGRRDRLAALVRRSLTAFVPLFEALLVLKDAEVPRSKKEVITAAVEAFGLDPAVFTQLLHVWSGEKLDRQALDRLVQQYAWEVRRLALTVDAM